MGLAAVAWNMSLVSLAVMVSWLAPGPLMVTSCVEPSTPLVRMIGLTTWLISNVMILPEQASIRACRNDPEPLSAFVVTTGSVVQVSVVVAAGPLAAVAGTGAPTLKSRVAKKITTWNKDFTRVVRETEIMSGPFIHYLRMFGQRNTLRTESAALLATRGNKPGRHRCRLPSLDKQIGYS
jgi:hypothetical protein